LAEWLDLARLGTIWLGLAVDGVQILVIANRFEKNERLIWFD
jgi:hypothetical protein